MAAFLGAAFFLAAFFLAAFLGAAFFLAAFLGAAFFLAAFFLVAFLAAAFFGAAFFFATFLAAAFLGAAFFFAAFLAGLDFFFAATILTSMCVNDVSPKSAKLTLGANLKSLLQKIKDLCEKKVSFFLTPFGTFNLPKIGHQLQSRSTFCLRRVFDERIIEAICHARRCHFAGLLLQRRSAG